MELRRYFDKVNKNTLLLKHQHPQQCFIYFIYKSFSNQFYDKYKYNIMPISKMSLHNYKTFKAKLFLCWHRTAQRGISFKKKQTIFCVLTPHWTLLNCKWENRMKCERLIEIRCEALRFIDVNCEFSRICIHLYSCLLPCSIFDTRISI